MNEELTPSDFDGFQTYGQCRDAEIERLRAAIQAQKIALGDQRREIERLQHINVSLVAQERGFREEIERLEFLNKEERETIDDLSRLCIRAADALETLLLGIDAVHNCTDTCTQEDSQKLIECVSANEPLIAELRKAAE